MNNTYKAILFIIFINLITGVFISQSPTTFIDNDDAYTVSVEGLEEDIFIENPNLQKEFVNQQTTTWSKASQLIKTFGKVHLPNTESDSFSNAERLIIGVTGWFYIIMNTMLGVLMYKLFRGSQ